MSKRFRRPKQGRRTGNHRRNSNRQKSKSNPKGKRDESKTDWKEYSGRRKGGLARHRPRLGVRKAEAAQDPPQRAGSGVPAGLPPDHLVYHVQTPRRWPEPVPRGVPARPLIIFLSAWGFRIFFLPVDFRSNLPPGPRHTIRTSQPRMVEYGLISSRAMDHIPLPSLRLQQATIATRQNSCRV